MNYEISQKDKEYIDKQVTKAIKSFDWEDAVHEALNNSLEWVLDSGNLDYVLTDMISEALRKIFKERGLIEE